MPYRVEDAQFSYDAEVQAQYEYLRKVIWGAHFSKSYIDIAREMGLPLAVLTLFMRGSTKRLKVEYFYGFQRWVKAYEAAMQQELGQAVRHE